MTEISELSSMEAYRALKIASHSVAKIECGDGRVTKAAEAVALTKICKTEQGQQLMNQIRNAPSSDEELEEDKPTAPVTASTPIGSRKGA